jgi:hypothetical protein
MSSSLDQKMATEKRTEFVTRDSILKELADDERKSVNKVEKEAGLQPGEEYLDLERLEAGVQRGPNTTTAMTNVLPRRSVRPETWSRIMARVSKAIRDAT